MPEDPAVQKKRSFGLQTYLLTLYFLFWGAYFADFWSHAWVTDHKGNLIAGNINLWGDWPIHFTMGSAMAYRHLFLLKSPLLIGAPFRYPFFADFLSAVLIRLGVPFIAAFTVPSFLCCISLPVVLFLFYKMLFDSRKIAIIASLIFLLNGGLGFVQFGKDIVHSKNVLQTIINPPRTYTRMDDLHIHWISVIDSMMIPQRSFTLGFPLALLSLILALDLMDWRRRGKTDQDRARAPDRRHRAGLTRFAALGAVVGFLPIVHTHSFLAVSLVLVFWAMVYLAMEGPPAFRLRIRSLTIVVVVAAAIALPILYLFIFNGMQPGFVKWYPGWYARSEKIGWLDFWWKNWGPALILAAAGLFLYLKEQKAFRGKLESFVMFLPFIVLFALVNLFLFQPWIWDNTKLLVWASVGISGLAAFSLSCLFFPEEHRYSFYSERWSKIRTAMRGLALVFFMVTVASGTVDAYRVLRPALNSYQLCTKEELELAKWVKENTPSDSIWLTGAYHNDWLFNFTGRQPLMTFEGWLWTQGYDYADVKKDMMTMFREPCNTRLFNRYHVGYAVIGPVETRVEGAQPRQFGDLYREVKHTKNYSIFSIKSARPRRGFLPESDSARLVGGLTKTVYASSNFTGDVRAIEKNSTDLEFHYDSGVKRPFPTPCSIIWRGYLKTPTSGTYVFNLASDDGAQLFIDGCEVVNNNGVHSLESRHASAELAAGFHMIRIEYFDVGGGAILSVKWRPPHGRENVIPADLLFHLKDK